MPESAADIFSRRIRELRQARGITQAEADELCGVGDKMFQLYETRIKRNPGLQTIEKIARGFGVEAWQLLTPEPPKAKRRQ